MNIESKVKELLEEQYDFDFQSEFWTDDMIGVLDEIVEATQKVEKSNRIELTNAYIDEADDHGVYEIRGRVKKCWIYKEDFNSVKHIK